VADLRNGGPPEWRAPGVADPNPFRGLVDIPMIHSFNHSFIVKSTQQTRVHDNKTAVENKHLHINKNKNTKASFRTQHTQLTPKTTTE